MYIILNEIDVRRDCEMKKIIKRWTVFSVIAIFCLLTGCGRAQGGKDVIRDGRVQVSFWYSGGKTAAGIMEGIIRDFNQSQDRYLVTGVLQASYDETFMKLQAGIAGNQAADIALLDSDKALVLGNKELLVPLDSYIQQDANFHPDDLIPVFYRQCQLEDGTVFAMPAYGTTQILYYNRDLFEKAGIDPGTLRTWQDVAEAASLIKSAAGGQGYGWEPMWGPDNLIDMALSNGGTFLNADGTKVTIGDPAWVESWEMVRQWIHEDQIMRIHSGGQGWEYWYKTMDDVLNGTAGGYTGSSGDQADLDFQKVGALEQPGFGTHSAAPVARVLQLVMVNSDKERTKEGVYEFMSYFAEASTQARWSMSTGYIPVRSSTVEDPAYVTYTISNPQALVPLNQAMHASADPVDPTGGKIMDALEIAADQVEIENVPASKALEEARQKAQTALDQLYSKNE